MSKTQLILLFSTSSIKIKINISNDESNQNVVSKTDETKGYHQTKVKVIQKFVVQ